MPTRAYYIPAGGKNLATLFAGVDFNNVAKYYLEVKSGGITIATTPVYQQCCGCCEDEYIRIHFVNYLGGVDAIDFKLWTSEHETRSAQFERAATYPLVKTQHNTGRFNVRSNDTLILLNNQYTDADREWLMEVYDSPVAWFEWTGTQGQSNSYIPVVILDKKIVKVPIPEERFIYELYLEVKLSHEKFIIRN